MSKYPARDLSEKIAKTAAISTKSFTGPHELEAHLRQIYHAIHGADLAKFELSDLRRMAPVLMQQLFEVRIGLRDQIADWHEKGWLRRPAEIALRDAFRIMRYAIDMLGEINLQNARLADGEHPHRAFTGRDYNTHVNPRFFTGRDIAFRSGDVLVVRGTAHNSAAIARIGDTDTQFSHTALVYIDKAGKHWAVEALIEDGAVTKPLEEMLGHGVGRAVLYRYKNPTIAARAAELAFERVETSKKPFHFHIPYDFSMRLTGRSKLFCAKLIHQAYLDASNGEVRVPLYLTRFDDENRDFFRSIGVRVRETYAPGDIDIDPRFDLIAEWQDYRITSALRRQDMVLTKFFEWMETQGYKFKPDWLIFLISIFGRLAGQLSDGVKDLLSSVIPKVPSNMRARTIAAIAMLHKTAESVIPSLAALDEDHVRMTGRPIDPDKYLEHLERLRLVSGGRIGYLKAR